MNSRHIGGFAVIHRHTGGLENSLHIISVKVSIHRHTGGLENKFWTSNRGWVIHRHTGGLEKLLR